MPGLVHLTAVIPGRASFLAHPGMTKERPPPFSVTIVVTAGSSSRPGESSFQHRGFILRDASLRDAPQDEVFFSG
jgi:hypothetical protein